MTRAAPYAVVAVIELAGTLLIGVALRDRDGGGTPSPAPSAARSAAATATVASPTATVAAGSPTPSQLVVLSDRFGFAVHSKEIGVRSETSDAVISSFAPKDRLMRRTTETLDVNDPDENVQLAPPRVRQSAAALIHSMGRALSAVDVDASVESVTGRRLGRPRRYNLSARTSSAGDR
jgi:hypothetical protein